MTIFTPSFHFELLCDSALVNFQAFEVISMRLDKIVRSLPASESSFPKAREGNKTTRECDRNKEQGEGGEQEK